MSEEAVSFRDDSHSVTKGGRRSLIVALLANLGIATAKCIAFLFTGSTSMVAEAAHSVADTSKQAFLLLGRVKARKKADVEHPFGYGPERYFWALVVAIVLFPLGALYSIYESISKLQDPQPIAHPEWAIATLLAAMVFEGVSLRVAIQEARRDNDGCSLWRFVRKARDPDIPSVLLEDAGAMVGLWFALLGIGLALLTGDPRYDAFGSFAIAALLLILGCILSVEFKSLVIGESATPEELDLLRRTILEESRVQKLIYVRTLHLAPEELLVAAKVELRNNPNFDEVAETIDAIEERVYRRLPTVRVMHVEPDRYAPHERGRPSWESEPGKKSV